MLAETAEPRAEVRARFLVVHGLIRDADPLIRVLTGFDAGELAASNGAVLLHPDDRQEYLVALRGAAGGEAACLRARVADTARRLTDCSIRLRRLPDADGAVEVLLGWADELRGAAPAAPSDAAPPPCAPAAERVLGLEHLDVEMAGLDPTEAAPSLMMVDERWIVTAARLDRTWSTPLVGRSLWNLGAPMPADLRAALERSMRSRTPTSTSMRVPLLQRTFTLHAVPVGSGLALIVLHTTAGERARLAAQRDAHLVAQLAALTDAASDPLMGLTVEWRVTFWNAAAERVFGFTRAEAVGAHALTLLRASSGTFPQMPAFLRLEHWHGEMEMLTRDGRPLTAAVRAQLMAPQPGAPQQIAVLCTDVTAQRQVGHRQRQQDRLENLAMLASGVTHDLNSVLTPILLASQLLQQRDPGVAAGPLLQAIESSAARGSNMVGRVLAVARGEGSDHAVVPFAEVLTQLVRYCASAVPARIELVVERPELLPAISADAGQILQVLVNLVDNAVQAIAGPGSITVRAAVDADTDLLRIAVQDTGAGIDEATVSKIFEPFFTTKGTAWGTGLGLAASRTIVEHHGGTLGVVSRSGQGSTFTVTLRTTSLPMTTADDAESAPLHAAGAATVLVADPDPATVATARAVLEWAGYRVLIATDAAGAQSWLDFGGFIDLVVIDTSLVERVVPSPGPRGADTRRLIIGPAPLHRPPGSDAALLPEPFSKSQLLTAARHALEPRPAP